MEVTFDGTTGLLKQIGNIESKIHSKVSQQLLYYIGMRGNNSEPKFTASGAYLFRPNSSHPIPLATKVTVTKVKVNFVLQMILLVITNYYCGDVDNGGGDGE